jgi:hypothetical protein
MKPRERMKRRRKDAGRSGLNVLCAISYRFHSTYAPQEGIVVYIVDIHERL